MKKIKKDIIEYLGFEEDEKPKVGRPRLADSKTKKRSLIIASFSFMFVILLLIFGYGTLFGFRSLNLKASITNNEPKEQVLVEEINPLTKNITLKVDTARKVYLTVLPANASNKEIEYESLNPSIASVDKDGKVVGLKQGEAKIVATTTDGSNLSATFNITVIKNAEGYCSFTSLSKTSSGVSYVTNCKNATIKEIQYKIADGSYEKLLTKKSSDEVKFSDEQLKKDITFKIVYYPNNSKITDYSTKTIKVQKKTTKAPTGSCFLDIKEVNSNSAKYDITCENASVNEIAYKIGNGSYIGLNPSSLADTIIFEESDVTRVIYFNVSYTIDGTTKVNTITKNSVIEKGRSQ